LDLENPLNQRYFEESNYEFSVGSIKIGRF